MVPQNLFYWRTRADQLLIWQSVRWLEIVHSLTKHTSLSSIESKIHQAQKLYIEIYELSKEANDDFRVCFKDFKKDVDWNDYLD